MPNLDFSNVKFFADKIMVLENAISEEDCNWIIDSHVNLDSELDDENNQVVQKLVPWQTSSVDSPHVYGTKREAINYDGTFERSTEHVKRFFSYLEDFWHQIGKFYHEELGLTYDPESWTDYATFQYLTGQEMGPHVDYDGEIDLAPIATGLLYLNNNKVGGDLYFKEQDVLVQSKAGTVVVFPCVKPFYHQSTLITEGEKYHVGCGWKKPVEHINYIDGKPVI
jgi:hypothetical protein